MFSRPLLAGAQRRSAVVRSLLALVLFAISAHLVPAQEDAAPEPQTPPPPADFQNRFAPAQLAFLNDYSTQTTHEIWKDKRFRTLVKQMTPWSEFHYGQDMALSEAIDTMLGAKPRPVEVRENRYVTITSQGGPYLQGRGFVWFDMQEGIALGGIFFHPTNGEPTPTLAIFSRQLKTEDLSFSQLPAAFQMDLAQWSAESRVPAIPVTYFIPENGKKYPLLHDEDYCAHAPGMPAPSQYECEGLNAAAADADMSGAYFMHISHNAANATAWVLESEQIAWVGMRDRTCGAGGLACRIRVTRARTRVLIRRR